MKTIRPVRSAGEQFGASARSPPVHPAIWQKHLAGALCSSRQSRDEDRLGTRRRWFVRTGVELTSVRWSRQCRGHKHSEADPGGQWFPFGTVHARPSARRARTDPPLVRIGAALCLPRQTRRPAVTSVTAGQAFIRLVRPAYEQVLRSAWPFGPAASITILS